MEDSNNSPKNNNKNSTQIDHELPNYQHSKKKYANISKIERQQII